MVRPDPAPEHRSLSIRADMNIVLRTAALTSLGHALLSALLRLVPVQVLAHPGRHPGTGR